MEMIVKQDAGNSRRYYLADAGSSGCCCGIREKHFVCGMYASREKAEAAFRPSWAYHVREHAKSVAIGALPRVDTMPEWTRDAIPVEDGLASALHHARIFVDHANKRVAVEIFVPFMGITAGEKDGVVRKAAEGPAVVPILEWDRHRIKNFSECCRGYPEKLAAIYGGDSSEK